MSDSVLSETREQARAAVKAAIVALTTDEDGDWWFLYDVVGSDSAPYLADDILDALLRPELRVSLLTLLGLRRVPVEGDDERECWISGPPLPVVVPHPVFVEEGQ